MDGKLYVKVMQCGPDEVEERINDKLAAFREAGETVVGFSTTPGSMRLDRNGNGITMVMVVFTLTK